MFSHTYPSTDELTSTLAAATNPVKNMVGTTTIAAAVAAGTVASNVQNTRLTISQPQNHVITHASLYTQSPIISPEITQSTGPVFSSTWPWLNFSFIKNKYMRSANDNIGLLSYKKKISIFATIRCSTSNY